ncbi:MAG TPA: dihydroorotase, partial [Solirubrobacteraceae bacterium]|nr:dihydroorotase [Solirubrobacteraceae bacterium]
MHEGEVSAELGLAGIPAISESTMIARDALIAAHEGGRAHFQHLSARASVVALAAAKAAGARVSGEASPHHLLLTDAAVRGLDSSVKMNPPLRTEDDRQALIDALRDGTIDCVATDHAPHSRDEKAVPFEQAPMGVTGLETAFAALHTDLVLPGVLALATLVERLTAGAALFELETPTIAPDAVANLTLIDLDATWRVGESGYESRSANCAFAGRELTGRVLLTVAGGRVAYRERAFALSAA